MKRLRVPRNPCLGILASALLVAAIGCSSKVTYPEGTPPSASITRDTDLNGTVSGASSGGTEFDGPGFEFAYPPGWEMTEQGQGLSGLPTHAAVAYPPDEDPLKGSVVAIEVVDARGRDVEQTLRRAVLGNADNPKDVAPPLELIEWDPLSRFAGRDVVASTLAGGPGGLTKRWAFAQDSFVFAFHCQWADGLTPEEEALVQDACDLAEASFHLRSVSDVDR